MKSKSFLFICFFCLVSWFAVNSLAYVDGLAVDYLCELGTTYYSKGNYEEALQKFKEVLLVDSNNQTAKKYINLIISRELKASFSPDSLKEESRARENPPPRKTLSREVSPSETILGKMPSREIIPRKTLLREASPRKTPSSEMSPKKTFSREEIISNTLSRFDIGVSKQPIEKTTKKEKEGINVSGVNITGEVQARAGFTSENTIWKRANWDLNEYNYRTLSDIAFDKRENTYDSRIYDRLKIKLDTDKEEGFGFHTNITVDPWSFTGKSDKMTLTGAGGDSAEVELKYWSNTGYTLNEGVCTSQNGDVFNLPEIKVVNGKTRPATVTSAWGNTFSLPEAKIYREFQPLREFWFDYKQDNLKLRFFPIAYENQALTFDDPLRLSNNRIWWEDSPWLRKWTPGNRNTGVIPVDFNPGYWDNTLSFFTRDSEGQRLTGLRGFTFEFNPQETTSFVTSVASPKNLWQDYSDMDNLISASRLKQSITERIDLGVTATSRLGYNLNNDSNKLDARNYVGAVDLGYEIINGVKTTLEAAHSDSKYNITDSQYETNYQGSAYQFSLFGRFSGESIMDTKFGYEGIKPSEDEKFFTKFRFLASRMDDSFDQPLSSYVETRDDEWWGRHLHFREPFKHYYQGEGQLLSWDDVKSSKIGTGLDIGRQVLGLRVESTLWDKKVDNLFDVRNVHSTDDKFLENVIRDELTWKATDKLTLKGFGIYQKMPKTVTGVDSFVFDPRTRRYFDNSLIQGGKDASLDTGSLGLEYKFFEWMALNGIWEYTNDHSANYENFPRGLLNGGNRSYLFSENGNTYRDVRNWLYDQQYFPQPPYHHYNIFKSGLRLDPLKDLQVYLDYTKNEYKYAGPIDDNMNHVGIEFVYTPIEKIGIFLRYTYSRWKDLDKITQNLTEGHHNVFTEFTYHKSLNEDLTFQYGEGSRDPFMGGVLDIGWDPYGGSLSTIDTQHIIRLYYRRKF